MSRTEFLTFSLKDKIILQVLPSLGQGGVERGTLEVAQALQNVSAHAWVASASGPLVISLLALGGRHFNLPLNKKNPWAFIWNTYCLYRLIRREKIDLVHARSRAPAWCAYFATRLSKTPFVTTFHGSYNFNNSFKKFYNSVMVRGDRVIAVSSYIYQHIAKYYRSYICLSNVISVPRGVDTGIFHPEIPNLASRIQSLKHIWQLHENKPVILLPGRLTRWKGQETALKAFALLKDFSGVLICLGSAQGRDHYLQELKELAKTLKIEERIHFISHCQDMPAAYAMAELVLHTSTDPEAFGRTIIEAQAMGKCVIATAHGAPLEIIQEGITGYLVEPGRPDLLADKIKLYFSLSLKEKEDLAQAALVRTRSLFSTAQMIQGTFEVYQELLKEK